MTRALHNYLALFALCLVAACSDRVKRPEPYDGALFRFAGVEIGKSLSSPHNSRVVDPLLGGIKTTDRKFEGAIYSFADIDSIFEGTDPRLYVDYALVKHSEDHIQNVSLHISKCNGEPVTEKAFNDLVTVLKKKYQPEKWQGCSAWRYRRENDLQCWSFFIDLGEKYHHALAVTYQVYRNDKWNPVITLCAYPCR